MATLAGALCGLLGVFVVLRGMSYIGHGLSHAIFGGAVVSYVAGVNFYAGAGAWGLLAAVIIGRIARSRSIGADAAIGIVTTASFAVGVALLSRAEGFTRNFEAALFGQVLGVTTADLVAVAVVCALAGAMVWMSYGQLLFSTFDPDVAEVSGVRVARADLMLALILAATVTVTMNVIGVTVIAAALVIPAATARALTDSFRTMLVLSTTIGAATGAAGVYLSYLLDVPSGASIVLTGAAVFASAFVWSGRDRTVPTSRGV